MIKHILFDCDGVLIDTEIVAACCFVSRVKKEGMVLTVEQYLTRHTGSTFTAVFEHFFRDTHTLQQRILMMNDVEQEVADRAEGIAGVEAMLAALSISKSIVSNSHINRVEEAMEKLGLTDFFSGQVFSSELVARPKPAPDVYILALEQLGLNPDELIVVEDSLTGVSAAKAAGLEVIGFTGASHILPGHAEQLAGLGVEIIAEDMIELTEILSNRVS
jgi:HAD superfamily hydrolase (TIGR01509 family)